MTLNTTNRFCNYSPIKRVNGAGYAQFGIYWKWSSPDRHYHLIILKDYFLDIFIFLGYETVALWSVNANFPWSYISAVNFLEHVHMYVYINKLASTVQFLIRFNVFKNFLKILWFLNTVTFIDNNIMENKCVQYYLNLLSLIRTLDIEFNLNIKLKIQE